MKSFLTQFFNSIDKSIFLRSFMYTFFIVMALSLNANTYNQKPVWVKNIERKENSMFSKSFYMGLMSEGKRQQLILEKLKTSK